MLIRPLILFGFGLLLVGCVPVIAPENSTQPASSASGVVAETRKEGSPTLKIVPSPLMGSGALPERLLETGILVIGQKNAPLTLVLFTNHSCRYCREFEEVYFPRLTEDFLRAGKLKLEIVLLPLKKYPESALAASSLFCAAAQGKGLLMHESLFDTSITRRSVIDLAETLSLDTDIFGTCLDAPETARVLLEQASIAEMLATEFVPTFFLNGEKFIGLPTYADLRGRIENQE
ncbi:hypothetical protein A3D88_03285 [Candidatus Peribacteria bacterium RIFCSPHIGHO2_02_FULL_52_16]|nr:MAG: hypothetical protein A2706_04105 [Candidatus Peribacteria bacterium RIFCSPHIGHO2_01_FULL_51_35]OGJ61353.1 MAG: hypothetical protein A3D88_03285 [Candidatus Peribacteria bacterium RIFCSPHIGHO2_02_FULL_52_16]